MIYRVLSKALIGTTLLLAFSANAFSQSLPAVEVRNGSGPGVIEWDPVPGAAGYNIHMAEFSGINRSGSDAVYDYLDTVTSGTTYTVPMTGAYAVVAYDAGGLNYSPINPALTINIGVDSGTEPTDTTSPPEDTHATASVTRYFDALGRYIVTNTCEGTSCEASCQVDGNVGNATGGFCKSNTNSAVQSTGTQRSYQCEVSEYQSNLVAGVYCVP